MKHAFIVCDSLYRNGFIDKLKYHELYAHINLFNNMGQEHENSYAKKILEYCVSLKFPSLSFGAARLSDLSAFGVLGIGILLQDSPKKSIEFALNNQMLTEPFARVEMVLGDKLTFLVQPIIPNLTEEEYRFAVEYHCQQIYHLLKKYGHKNINLEKVMLSYSEPYYVDLYTASFGCEIVFNSVHNAIVFNRNVLDKFQMNIEVNQSLIKKMVLLSLEKISHGQNLESTLKNRIFLILNTWSKVEFPNEESIAYELNMHPRTLRRKLKNEGESFREIISNFKKERAIRLLKYTNKSYKQIAYELGFSNGASFSKAFFAWTGENPSSYRMNENN